MPQINMPEHWEPPYPSWSAEYDAAVSAVVMSYIGAQSVDGGADEFHGWIHDAMASEHGAQVVDRAIYVDAQGHTNEVYIGYWADHRQDRHVATSSTVYRDKFTQSPSVPGLDCFSSQHQ